MSEGITPEPRSSFPAGARCALHPERLAAHTCVRCGNYMCPECASTSLAGQCLTCANRDGASTGFPYTRDNYTFDGLLNVALSRWKQNWLTLGLVYAASLLIVYVPAILLSVAAGSLPSLTAMNEGDHSLGALAAQGVGQVIAIVVQLASQLVIFGICLDVLEQVPLGFGRAMARLKALPHMLLQLFLIYAVFGLCAGLGFGLFQLVSHWVSPLAAAVVVGGLTLPLLPAAVYVGLGLAFILIELAHNPEANALSALRRSWQLADGRRWSMAGVLSVSGLIGGAGVFLCCVGVLASAPLGMLLYAVLFLALSQPTPANARPIAPEFPV